MEIRATRQEIRNRAQRVLGQRTGASQAGMVLDLLNELIREAQNVVIAEWKWQPEIKEFITEIEIDQSFVNYPPNSAGGSVMQVAVYHEDDLMFIPLQSGRIPLALDDDALEPLMLEADAEGDQDEVDRLSAEDYSNNGFPCVYEQRSQLKIWPASDRKRKLKFLYTECTELTQDTQESAVDADLIYLHTVMEGFLRQGDDVLAASYEKKFQARMRKLKRWQHTRDKIKVGAADAAKIRARNPRYAASLGLGPNYDTSPSVPIPQPIPGSP